MRPASILRCLPLLALGACATAAGVADTPPVEMTGHYTAASGSWFRPCAGADSLWVTFTGAAVAQRESAVATGRLQPAASSFVRWRAVAGEPGQRGATGPGTRYVLVRELLEARPAAASDCGVR